MKVLFIDYLYQKGKVLVSIDRNVKEVLSISKKLRLIHNGLQLVHIIIKIPQIRP